MSSLKLYAWGTPNGQKIAIMLEALKLKHELHIVDLSKSEQRLPEYLKLNPNGRIPTIVDSSTGITVSQTGAILLYLAENYDKDYKFSFPQGTKEYYQELEILAFQISEHGPLQGQAKHFVKHAPEKVPYGITRYVNEVRRVYAVFEEYLQRNKANGPYFVGDHYSIVDFAVYPWAYSLRVIDVDIKEWPLVSNWLNKLGELPAVQKAMEFNDL